MRFNCKFPECIYETDNRHQIHNHHIIPKEMGGDNAKHNKIMLCPNHHSNIYIPSATKGIHSKYSNTSIIIKRYLNGGLFLEYEIDNKTFFKEIL